VQNEWIYDVNISSMVDSWAKMSIVGMGTVINRKVNRISNFLVRCHIHGLEGEVILNDENSRKYIGSFSLGFFDYDSEQFSPTEHLTKQVFVRVWLGVFLQTKLG